LEKIRLCSREMDGTTSEGVDNFLEVLDNLKKQRSYLTIKWID